jgi:hypothetical protein
LVRRQEGGALHEHGAHHGLDDDDAGVDEEVGGHCRCCLVLLFVRDWCLMVWARERSSRVGSWYVMFLFVTTNTTPTVRKGTQNAPTAGGLGEGLIGSPPHPNTPTHI